MSQASLPQTVRTARMHEIAQAMQTEIGPRPTAPATDVVVRVTSLIVH